MSGKKERSGKRYTEADYLAAINVALANNYITDFVLISKDVPIDKEVIKKNAYENLSDEAREIILTVVERPDDFIEFAFNNSSSYVRHRSYNHKLKRVPSKALEKRLIDIDLIRYYFCKKWGVNLRYIKKVCEEIKELCECF